MHITDIIDDYLQYYTIEEIKEILSSEDKNNCTDDDL